MVDPCHRPVQGASYSANGSVGGHRLRSTQRSRPGLIVRLQSPSFLQQQLLPCTGLHSTCSIARALRDTLLAKCHNPVCLCPLPLRLSAPVLFAQSALHAPQVHSSSRTCPHFEVQRRTHDGRRIGKAPVASSSAVGPSLICRAVSPASISADALSLLGYSVPSALSAPLALAKVMGTSFLIGAFSSAWPSCI